MSPTNAVAFVSILIVFVILVLLVGGVILYSPELDIARLGLLLGFFTTISNILSGTLGYLFGNNKGG